MYFERKKNISIFAFFCLSLFILIAYSNTFSVPFLFDDFASIVNKENVYSEGFSAIYQSFSQRIVTYSTFKINFDLHQLNVFGYHVVNTGVHIICSFLVYLFTLELLKLSALNEKTSLELSIDARWFALFVSLIFATHPLQTQAVTYIVQRATSLAALFYIAAMLSYLKFRLVDKVIYKLLLCLLIIVISVLAIFTKQSAYTIPIALIVLEIVFIYPILRYPTKKLFMLMAVLGVVIVSCLVCFPEILIKIDAASKETLDFSRFAYFESQLSVIIHYIGLFFYPSPLQVEYIYPLADGTFVHSISYLVAYLAIALLAIVLIRKQPVISFAIFLFFIAHAVESSFIPISDLVFEHRTYLPNLSLSLLTVLLFQKLLSKNEALLTIVLILIVLGGAYLTYQRNALWAQPINLYKIELAINNKKPRIHAMLGEHYREVSKHQLSAQSYKLAYELTGDFNTLDNQGYEAKFGYFNNYVAALSRTGNNIKAINLTLNVLPQLTGSKYLAIIYTNLGGFYWQEKNYLHCTKYMFQAMKLDPNYIAPVMGVGKCFEEMGDKEMAVHMFDKAKGMYLKSK